MARAQGPHEAGTQGRRPGRVSRGFGRRRVMTEERKRLGPPPVEPLSDITWSRVERGMWSRLEGTQTNTMIQPAPPSRRWMFIAAPLAAAAAILLVIGLHRGP